MWSRDSPPGSPAKRDKDKDKREPEKASSLVLPDLGQLKPLLRFERGGLYASGNVLDEMAKHEEKEKEREALQRSMNKQKRRRTAGRRDSPPVVVPDTTLPPPMAKGRVVHKVLAGVETLNPGAREWITNMVTRYEAKIEALEEELRAGCLSDLRASLMRDAVEKQSDLSQRQYRAILSLQKKVLMQEAAPAAGKKGEHERRVLQEQLEDKKQQCDHLQHQLKMTQKETEDLRNRLDVRTREVVTLKNRIEDLNEQVAEAEALAMSIEEEKRKVEQELAEQQVLMKEAEEKAAKRGKELEEKIDRLLDEAEDLRKAHKEELKKQDALHERAIEAVKLVAAEERKQLEAECNQLRGEVSIANAARERAEERAEEAEAKAAQMESFKEAVEGHLAVVEGLLSDTPASGCCVAPTRADDLFSPTSNPVTPSTNPITSPKIGHKKKKKKKEEDDDTLPTNVSETPAGLEESTTLSDAASAVVKTKVDLGPRSMRRAIDNIVKRLGGEAKGLKQLISLIHSLESQIVMLNTQFDAFRQEAADKLAHLAQLLEQALADVEVARKREEEAENRMNGLLKRLEQLEGADSPLVKEAKEHQVKAKKIREAEKKLHMAPQLPEGFRRFLERTEKSRQKTEERVAQERERILDERTRKEYDMLIAEGGMGRSMFT
eukprot:Hpha_TRINITY_DN16775_c1_g4::TRINITY_DN16775_c1_g4_i1::g.76650::m.76650